MAAIAAVGLLLIAAIAAVRPAGIAHDTGLAVGLLVLAGGWMATLRSYL